MRRAIPLSRRAQLAILGAALTLAPSPADACSCIATDTAPPKFEAWPREGVVALDAHFWVQRRAEGEIDVLANGRSIPVELRPRLDTLFEVVPKAPLPPRSLIEVRARTGDRLRTLSRVTSALEPAGKLAAGGDVAAVDAHDGNGSEPCSNGSPKATIHFAPFAVAAPRPVPYAIWLALDPAPLVVDRPPDRIIFVDGASYAVTGGSICEPAEYWLPTGKGGARLSAAKIDTDGATLTPVTVAFRAALDDNAQRVETERCIAEQKAAVKEATEADDGPRARMELHTSLARGGAWAAIALTVLSLAIAGLRLLRSPRLSRVALALSAIAASMLAVPVAMQSMLEQDRRDDGARRADRAAKERELSACYKVYPRP